RRAARRAMPVVILWAPAVPGSPGVSGHRDNHRGRTGCTSRLGAIAVCHTGDRDAAWHGPPGTGVVSVPKALQVSEEAGHSSGDVRGLGVPRRRAMRSGVLVAEHYRRAPT